MRGIHLLFSKMLEPVLRETGSSEVGHTPSTLIMYFSLTSQLLLMTVAIADAHTGVERISVLLPNGTCLDDPGFPRGNGQYGRLCHWDLANRQQSRDRVQPSSMTLLWSILSLPMAGQEARFWPQMAFAKARSSLLTRLAEAPGYQPWQEAR